MPDFTNLLNQYRQMNDEQVGDEILEEELGTSDANNLIPNNHYKQWYEFNPERLELERQAFEKRGFVTARLNDGRICFSSEELIESNLNIVIICDWLYPLQPPQVFAEGNKDVIDLIAKNNDNSLNLLTDSSIWQPAMSAVTMLDYLLELVEVVKKPTLDQALE